MHTYIAAEIGINHNGDLELAKRLIDIAVEAGERIFSFTEKKSMGRYTACAKRGTGIWKKGI